MAVGSEQRTLLNKQLLAAARGQGNVEELLTAEDYRDPEGDYLFDINCTDISGNTPLHLAVLSGSVDDVDSLVEAYGCDVDPQNLAGNTPLHLAVQIQDQDTRHAIVSALVDAGADDSMRLTNKARQTPKDLAEIYWPDDTETISLTTPQRKINNILGGDDIASDGELEDADSE